MFFTANRGTSRLAASRPAPPIIRQQAPEIVHDTQPYDNYNRFAFVLLALPKPEDIAHTFPALIRPP